MLLYLSILFLFISIFIYLFYNNMIYYILRLINYCSNIYYYNFDFYSKSNIIDKIIINNKIYTDEYTNKTLEQLSKINELKIIFYMEKNRYIVLFNYNQLYSTFPIYTLEELNVKKGFNESSDNIVYIELYDINNEQMIHSDKINKQIMSIIKEFSGPKGNFYLDKNMYNNTITKDFLKKNVYQSINNILSNITYIGRIEILYSNGDTYTL